MKLTIPENYPYQFHVSLLILPIFIVMIFKDLISNYYSYQNWIFESHPCCFSMTLAGALCEKMNFYFEQDKEVSILDFVKEFRTTYVHLFDSLSAGMLSNNGNGIMSTQSMHSTSFFFEDINMDDNDSKTGKVS